MHQSSVKIVLFFTLFFVFPQFLATFAALKDCEMMTMKFMQFSAVLLFLVLTLKLLFLPPRHFTDPKVNRSRWMMAGGSALLAIQFLLQFVLGLRETNVDAALTMNLAFFIPCSALFSLSILNLQRQGVIAAIDKYIGIVVWILAMALSYWSVVAASTLYAAMQTYYSVKQVRLMRKIRFALADYYDSDIDELLRWMRWAVFIMAMMAILVPLMIFVQGPMLAVFAILCLIGLFYLVDCFTLFTVCNTPAQVGEAQQIEADARHEEVSQKSEDRVSESAVNRVEKAVNVWIEHGGHLQTGLNLPNAAEAIGVPRYLLSAWLKQGGLRYNDWLTGLRIDEAMRVMRDHPDWSNEAVAQHCGFSDRTYFQRKFKQITGLTPNDFLLQ